jgi:hypothetical protein
MKKLPVIITASVLLLIESLIGKNAGATMRNISFDPPRHASGNILTILKTVL